MARVADIPADFDGVMGVPISFMRHCSAEQFEIVGEASHGTDSELDLFRPLIRGRQVFERILIRNREPAARGQPAASVSRPEEEVEAARSFSNFRNPGRLAMMARRAAAHAGARPVRRLDMAQQAR